MRLITTILALAVLALPSCRHGRTGPQGEPGIGGEPGIDSPAPEQDGPLVVLRGIDGFTLPDYLTVSDALPDDLSFLGALADDDGILIVVDGVVYAVRTRGEELVVLRSAEEGDLEGGEIKNSPGRLAVGDTVIFTGAGPKSDK